MKKRSLKIIAMIIVMCFIVGCMPVSADTNIETNTPATTIKINEYEEITELQKNTAEELQAKGYSEQEAEEILSFSYRDALLERANLPESSLRAKGYNETQIAFMKEFAKDPNGNYNFSVMAIDLTTRSFTLIAGASSSRTKTVRYNWKWSTMPLMAFQDSVAMRWQAYNRNGLSIDSTCYNVANSRYGSVNYFNDYGLAKTESLEMISYSGFDCMRANFKMSKTYNGDIIWAKSGSITCKIELSSPYSSMDHMKVQATYGHATMQFSLGISFPAAFGVSFSTFCTNYYRTAEIRSSITYLD